jgi:hypothetical protein
VLIKSPPNKNGRWIDDYRNPYICILSFLSGELCSQPRLNPFRQRTEIRDALQFVIRQLYMEVVF